MKKFIIYFVLLISSISSQAQVPGKPQERAVIIKNAFIHIGNGTTISNGFIRFEKGIITYVGSTSPAETNAEVIDANGKHVYPGLIAPLTKLGLEEIEAVRSTLDYNEVGLLNPNIRSIIAYNTDSKIIPTVRSNGVLSAMIVPEGGLITGTSSLVKLDGWNWEDAVYAMDIAIHINWPRMRISNAWWAPSPEEQRKTTEKNLDQLKTFFDQAKSYHASGKPAEMNLKYEAMKSVFDGKKKLIIRASAAKEIMSAVNFAKSYGITPIIAGADDAYMITDFIKSQGVSVILDQPHALPSREDDDTDGPYKRAYALKQKDIPYCISIDGSWQQRNLPFMAGTTAAFGVEKEDALQSVTLNTAKILGVDKTLGSLEVNKDATLLISEGDLMDMRFSNVTHAFIKGSVVDLNNLQKDLYKKFSEKYGIKE